VLAKGVFTPSSRGNYGSYYVHVINFVTPAPPTKKMAWAEKTIKNGKMLSSQVFINTA